MSNQVLVEFTERWSGPDGDSHWVIADRDDPRLLAKLAVQAKRAGFDVFSKMNIHLGAPHFTIARVSMLEVEPRD